MSDPNAIDRRCRCRLWPSVRSRLVAVAGGLCLIHGAAAQSITMVSVRPGNLPGQWSASWSEASTDGRFVAFWSNDPLLVPNDANGSVSDVFLRDLSAGTTDLVSRNGSVQSNGLSQGVSMSADAARIVFDSEGSNLVAQDNNGALDVFVFEPATGVARLLSRSVAGVGTANGRSEHSTISRNGRFVVFSSWASDVVRGDTNGQPDVFVHDLSTGATERVSLDANGNELSVGSTWGQISEDGTVVAFHTSAALVAGDTNGVNDVYVRDRVSGRIELVSRSFAGATGNAESFFPALRCMSDDGRYVVFQSAATNLVANDGNRAQDLFRKDLATGRVEQVNVDDRGVQGYSYHSTSKAASISGDGRFVAFASRDGNLVPVDTNGEMDVFVRDCHRGTTRLISYDAQGAAANNLSSRPRITRDGRLVTFMSQASNLAATPANPASAHANAFLFDASAEYAAVRHLPGGCAGFGGRPRLYATPPVLAANVTVSGVHVQPSVLGVVFASIDRIGPLSLPGNCRMHLDPASSTAVVTTRANAAGAWRFQMTMPADRRFVGAVFHMQAVFAAGGPPAFAMTDAAELKLGD